ncbi:hypothetical protein GGR28_000592 [Lewinella aquimaris]|uniref:DUF1826 domain-containing protein n=1 Tax=Neolewinella aquimaris TaxID=1835722 RepID=A0A840DYD3_9BACT|nr:hypothetical protein [Neolewinella aquimaris]MBB4077991.1 hypothetical protein [Neolewinella aquimaris]
MEESSVHVEEHIRYVPTFQRLVSTPFGGEVNAMCWTRDLAGDFSEIVQKIDLKENMATVSREELCTLELSDAGQLARKTLILDLKALETYGASPTLNLIRCYERDDSFPFFPTDVYSFHVDRSPIPTDTFLCTYHGESSEILPNAQAEQKVLVPEIREALRKLFDGPEDGFEYFLSEYFFDLHYRPKLDAHPIRLGRGNLWRLAIDHPECKVPPCIHRAPDEKAGEPRLMLIC